MYNNISTQPPAPVIIVTERRSHAARLVAFLLWIAAGYVILRMVSSAFVFMAIASESHIPDTHDIKIDRSVPVHTAEDIEVEIAPIPQDKFIPPSSKGEKQVPHSIQLEVNVNRQSLMGTMIASSYVLFFLALGCLLAFSGLFSALAHFLYSLVTEVASGLQYLFHTIITFDFSGLATSIGHFFVQVFEEAKRLVLVDIPNFFKSLFGLNSVQMPPPIIPAKIVENQTAV